MNTENRFVEFIIKPSLFFISLLISIFIYAVTTSILNEGAIGSDYTFVIVRCIILLISILPFLACYYFMKRRGTDFFISPRPSSIIYSCTAILIVGLMTASTWNDLWLYNGWPGALGSGIWCQGYDGEASYDREFELMIIWIYLILITIPIIQIKNAIRHSFKEK